MPDFNTRKPQEPNEPNKLGISLLADKLRALLIASRHRIPLIANRSRSLLSASRYRVVLIGDRLRGWLAANRLRTLLISGGILLFVVAAVPIGLLIYSSSGMCAQQQEAQQNGSIVSGMQRRLMEDIKVDPDLSRKIVFELHGIYTMNANGSGLEELEDAAEDPARSPDLKKIAFTRLVEETIGEESASASASASPRAEGPTVIQVPYVFVMNADGSDEVQLVDFVGAKPDWSPDGEHIVFSSDESWSRSGISMDGECDLYVVNAEGSGIPRRLTTGPGCESNPAWSPDGTKIAFESSRGGNLDIYVMNACRQEGDTNQSQQLTDDPMDDTDPTWSPDGTQIAFTYSQDAHDINNLEADIYKMDADGSGRTRLSYGEGVEAQPTWSPDAKKITFMRRGYPGVLIGTGAPETTGLFIMDFDGTDPALVRVFESATASYPEWGGTAQRVGGAERAIKGEPTDQAIADWRAFDARLADAALQAYIERMNGLIRGKNLRDSENGVDLSGANLSGAQWSYVSLSGANLSNAILSSANLSSANLSGANLRDAELIEADLRGAVLTDANLEGAQLGAANMRGADLSGANLSGAQLDNTDLSGANLRGADLRNAELLSTHINGADLSSANLSDAVVAEGWLEFRAGKLNSAIMPDGSQHPPCTALPSHPCSQITAPGSPPP